MGTFDPLDAIVASPGDSEFHVARFNWEYLAVLIGLLEPLKSESYWEGSTEELVASMPGKISELQEMLDTPYDCPPAGEGTMKIAQIAYVLPANTQLGAILTQSQYNQMKFDTLVIDTIGGASIDSPGGLIVPAGNYLLDMRYNMFFSTAAYTPVKIIHDGTDIVFADQLGSYATLFSVHQAVSSDGENPIEVWINPSSAAAYWGYSAVYNIARVVGTLTLTELPA